MNLTVVIRDVQTVSGRGTPKGFFMDAWNELPESEGFASYADYLAIRQFPPSGWSWSDWRFEVHAIAIATVCELRVVRRDDASIDDWSNRVKREIHRRVEQAYRAEMKFHSLGTNDRLIPEQSDRDRQEREEIEPRRIALDRAKSDLVDADRVLIDRFFFLGQVQEEIGLDLGVSQSTVSRRIERLFQELRPRMEEILEADA